MPVQEQAPEPLIRDLCPHSPYATDERWAVIGVAFSVTTPRRSRLRQAEIPCDEWNCRLKNRHRFIYLKEDADGWIAVPRVDGHAGTKR